MAGILQPGLQSLTPDREDPGHDDPVRERAADAYRTRHPDGRLVAAILDARLSIVRADCRWRPGALGAARRKADRVSRRQRQDRHPRPPLPASLRLAVFRAQRGRWVAL